MEKSNFIYTFFPVGRHLFNQLAVEEGVTGRGGEGRDIRAMGAQSCVNIELDRSYVIDRYSAPHSEGPGIFASTTVPSERLKLTTVPGVYVSICSTSMAEIAKN